ncbi:RNA degradosome polyphosphate kinase [Henriciella mobilis]|uniref:RNA degradosome polyphosphate kinase n=1 Tax=Henriciella mobilis TaxID=2305467 RepID=UPI000E66B260|nr:RNA degradosome polyphosphate kinase [Henriciella mobilis]RIJ15623.1 RNA degradosome polyphosphate kinase [Henriciella mobilis]RIJ19087.1 RNA degradosome polyphosphate kinase [Henriciella mobilis]
MPPEEPESKSATRQKPVSETKLDAALIRSPDRFLNRELSWLRFNERVLEEAHNLKHPLLERLRFLSISASNLDEFFMVRYAGLREQFRAGVTRISQEGMTPGQQVEAIEAQSAKLMEAQQACWKELRDLLSEQKLEVLRMQDLGKADVAWLREHFESNVFPILTPQAVDPAHPFPFIPNLGFAVAFQLVPEKAGGEAMVGLVPMPAFSPRFIRLPDRSKKGIRFVRLESVIAQFMDMLFPGFSSSGHCVFRIVRDSDIEIEEEAEDLIHEFEILLKQRRRGRIVRIHIDGDAPQPLQDFITREIGAEPRDIMVLHGLLGMKSLSELIVEDRADLQFKPYEPRYPERIREMGGDAFTAIRAKDFIVHHPYESFDVVVQFIRQAAIDPDVIAIKQTLYRTTLNSPIVSALMEAAEMGKNVTALVEIKARFDEETNLRLARDLERAGVQVVYGFIDYKTHAKVSLVVRREGQKLQSYTHFGTGNYHPVTARIYTDLSLFTADPALGRDANKLFNYITAYREPPDLAPDFEKIAMSPRTLEPRLIELIEAEAKAARAGKPCGIWAKMNSLVDGDVIDALYRASQAGVPIILVVRGICCLRPGVEGLSENIQVKSLIGRFLEHSRIVCFANGETLPSPKAKVFISSADWMQRNLKRRVEALVPIENPTVHRQVLNQIMIANLNDDEQSWEMDGDGGFHRLRPPDRGEGFSAHRYFMENPSLSGRGNALVVSLPPRLAPRKRGKS